MDTKYDVKKLSKKELLDNTLALVKREKTYTLLIFSHLEEIESRRLYAELGYSSLFAYATKVLLYSENEAHLRISAMRLGRTNPEIKEKIATGKLTLTNAGLVASAINRQEKTSGIEMSTAEKNKIIEAVAEKSTRDAKIILEALMGANNEGKGEVRYKIEITEESWQMLSELKNKMGNYSDAELIQLLLSKKLAEINSVKVQEENKTEDKIETTTTKTRYIKKKVKEAVKKRSGNRCEYVSPITQQRCTEIHFLEFEHVIPYACGGRSSIENIKHLCSCHNKLAAIKYYGMEKMEQHFKTKRTLGEQSDGAT